MVAPFGGKKMVGADDIPSSLAYVRRHGTNTVRGYGT